MSTVDLVEVTRLPEWVSCQVVSPTEWRSQIASVFAERERAKHKRKREIALVLISAV